MSLQLFLAVTLASFSVLVAAKLVIASLTAGRWLGSPAWLAVNVSVVVVLVLALSLAPEQAGWIVAAVAVPFVIVPSILWLIVHRRLRQWRFRDAARAARIAAWLHPSRTARMNAAITEAQAIGEHGRQLAALEALRKGAEPEIATAIDISIRRARDDWPGLLALATGQAGHGLAWLEVRALGELGRLDDMVEAYARRRKELDAANQAMTELFVLAFTGQRRETDRFLATDLRQLAEEAKAYFRHVAALTADPQDQAARSALAALAEATPHHSLRLAIARHLGLSRHARLQELSARSRATLAELQARTGAEAEKDDAAGQPYRRTPATLVLLALIGAAFLWQVARDATEDVRALVDLGALWPPRLQRQGEWWRLGTATLLHFGWVHLAANALALYSLGSAVERRLGSLRLTLAYVVAGLGSSGTVYWLMSNRWIEAGVLVGASGAIMGLLGLLTVHQLFRWLRSRASADLDLMVNIGLVIAIQVAVDALIPQISSSAHISGFVIGTLVGGAFLLFPGRNERPAQQTR